jgi:hypothetical protein
LDQILTFGLHFGPHFGPQTRILGSETPFLGQKRQNWGFWVWFWPSQSGFGPDLAKPLNSMLEIWVLTLFKPISDCQTGFWPEDGKEMMVAIENW